GGGGGAGRLRGGAGGVPGGAGGLLGAGGAWEGSGFCPRRCDRKRNPALPLFDQPPLHDFPDRAFRRLLEDWRTLADLVQEILPDLAAGFDFERTEAVNREFLLEDWRGRESDLFFRSSSGFRGPSNGCSSACCSNTRAPRTRSCRCGCCSSRCSSGSASGRPGKTNTPEVCRCG